MAEQIQREINDADITDPEKLYEVVAKKLTAAGVEERLLAAFGAMDTQQQLELLVRYFGDDAIRRVLQQRREEALLAADPTRWLDSLLSQSRRSGFLPTGELPDRARVELGLYLPATIKVEDGRPDSEPIRTVTLIANGSGQFRLWGDQLARGRVAGSRLMDSLPLRLLSTPHGTYNWREGIHYQTLLWFTYEDPDHEPGGYVDPPYRRYDFNTSTNLWVGYCTVNGQDAFGG